MWLAYFWGALQLLWELLGGSICSPQRAPKHDLSVRQPQRPCLLRVDYHRRNKIMPNHTFTHVLNYALRKVCQQGGPACLPACQLRLIS